MKTGIALFEGIHINIAFITRVISFVQTHVACRSSSHFFLKHIIITENARHNMLYFMNIHIITSIKYD